MTSKAWLSLISLTVLVAAASGCGGSSSSSKKDGAAGSTGSGGSGGSPPGDGPSRGEINGTGGTAGESDASSGGDAMGGTPGTGGASGAGGSGGASTDATVDRGGGGSGGAAMDAAREVIPQSCAAGETCSGTYMCNATRCFRNEREVCHCVNNSLFCGPAPCDIPDASATDAQRDAVMTPMCPAGIQSGDDCNGGTDRMCETACTLNRQRTCFCNAATDNWFCSGFMRCQ